MAINRIFIGRAWVNKIKKEDSKDKGKIFISPRISKKAQFNDGENKEMAIKSASLVINGHAFDLMGPEGYDMLLYPQAKREGKQDAQFRFSLSKRREKAQEVDSFEEEEEEQLELI